MGTAKSQIELEGRRFIDRVARAALPAFDRVIAVTREGEPAPSDALETIHEQPHDGASPIYGIRRALDHGGDRVWILATDYPLVTSELLRHLRSRFERSLASMLVPVWHGHPQMLCAGYGSATRNVLDIMISSKQFRLRDLLTSVDCEQVGEAELRAAFNGDPLWNVNLPEELERLRRLYER